MSITYKETEYSVVVEGADIQLQSLHETIVIEGGWYDLRLECEDEARKTTYENGRPAMWTNEQVERLMVDSLEDYALSHASEGLVLNHNCN